MTTPQRHKIISETFLAAREMSPEQQAVYLHEACAGDPSLRKEVEALLAQDRDHPGFLEAPPGGAEEVKGDAGAIQTTLGASVHPERIDQYRILRTLGEGGMGIVYLAEQTEPMHRKVALKLIKLGMDTRQVLARFDSERQALAMMNHPNVARALDAGRTEQGRPYFVMEYVPGVQITDYCDRHRLGTRQRLELFIRVCQAVQHAHQKGIIHRDIKPSNVLVTVEGDEPVPKVIDFGVAKAMEHRLTQKTIFTEQGQLIGTPEYMSPEQAEMTALDVDTRTDIYSLGMLLYELLVGALPFDATSLRHAAFAEIQRIIREDEPPKPSTRLSNLGPDSTTAAQKRRTNPQTLARMLRGDLDWIAMKAIDKDRTRRYGTASEFAADVARYLNDEPVIASPPSARYRLRKFLQRNKRAVAAAAVFAVVLLAATGISVGFALSEAEQRRIAAAAMKEAQSLSSQLEAVTSMLTAVDAKRTQGREVTVRDILDQTAALLDERFQDQRELRATMYHTVGTTYGALGAFLEAQQLLGTAIDIREQLLGGTHRDTLESKAQLAYVLGSLGQLDEARDLIEQTLEAQRQTLGGDDLGTLVSMRISGSILYGLNRRGKAAERLQAALDGFQRTVGQENEQTLGTMSDLAAILIELEQLERAEPLARGALAGQRRLLGERHGDTLQTLYNLAGLLREQGKFAEAEPVFRDALEAHVEVFGKDDYRTALASGGLAFCLRRLGRNDEAEPYTLGAYEALKTSFGTTHPRTIWTVRNVVGLYEALGKPEQTRAACQALLADVRDLSVDEEAQAALDRVRRLAVKLTEDGYLHPAEQLLRGALDQLIERSGAYDTRTQLAASDLGSVLVRLKQYDEAEPVLLPAYATLHSELGADNRHTRRCVDRLVALYDAWQRPQKAAEWRAKLTEPAAPGSAAP